MVTNAYISRKALERGSTNVYIALDVFNGDFERGALFEHDWTVREAAESNFRALQVNQNSNRLTGVGGSLAYVVEDLFVHIVRTVTEVHSGYVYSSLNYGADLLVSRSRWSKGRDNLCASHHFLILVVGLLGPEQQISAVDRDRLVGWFDRSR